MRIGGGMRMPSYAADASIANMVPDIASHMVRW
jgi:hypothetical protein